MRLKEKKILQKFAATLKKFSAQGAKKVEYGNWFIYLLQRLTDHAIRRKKHQIVRRSTQSKHVIATKICAIKEVENEMKLLNMRGSRSQWEPYFVFCSFIRNHFNNCIRL